MSGFPGREQVMQTLERLEGSFDQWYEVLTASLGVASLDKDHGDRLRTLGVNRCLETAVTFEQWDNLDIHSKGIRGGILTEEQTHRVKLGLAGSARKLFEINRILISIQHSMPSDVRHVLFKKIRELPLTDTQWLKALRQLSSSVYGPYPEFIRLIIQLVLKKLLPKSNSFSALLKILTGLPHHGEKEASRIVLKRMIPYARTRKQWQLVLGMAQIANMRTLIKQARREVIRRTRTFRAWCEVHPRTDTEESERISALRRLAKTFKQWHRIYDITEAKQDLREMKKIGTFEDWSALRAYGRASNPLIITRNEMLASYLQ